MNAPAERRALRREIRRRRRALSASDRRAAASALSNRLAGTGWFINSRTIAVYLSNDGEIDLLPLVARAWAMGKRTYLPRLFGPKLWFLPFHPQTVLAANRFSIPEPVEPARRRIRPPVPRPRAVSARRFRPVREPARDGRWVLRPDIRGGAPPHRMAGAEAGRSRLRAPEGEYTPRRRLGCPSRRYRHGTRNPDAMSSVPV